MLISTFFNNRNSRALMLAIAGGTFLGLMSPNLAPFQLGALIDHLGFNEERAGTLVTLELLVMSGAALLSPLGFSRISYSRFAFIGLLIAIMGQTATVFVQDYATLTFTRVIAAFGLGMIYGAANASGARSNNPEQVFAIAVAITLVIYAVFLPVVAMIASRGGTQWMYGAIVIFMILVAPILRGLDTDVYEDSQSSSSHGIPWVKFLTLLVVLVLYNLGTGAAWSFAERAGVQLGLEAETIATVVGLSTLAGIPGSLAVTWVGGKFGRTLPLFFGLSMGGIACYLLASGISVVFYAMSSWLYWLSYMFMYPYLVGIAASLDKEGRCSAFAAGTLMLSFSLGPFLGALLVSSFSFQALAWYGLLSCVAAAILMVPLSFFLDREEALARA